MCDPRLAVLVHIPVCPLWQEFRKHTIAASLKLQVTLPPLRLIKAVIYGVTGRGENGQLRKMS